MAVVSAQRIETLSQRRVLTPLETIRAERGAWATRKELKMQTDVERPFEIRLTGGPADGLLVMVDQQHPVHYVPVDVRLSGNCPQRTEWMAVYQVAWTSERQGIGTFVEIK